MATELKSEGGSGGVLVPMALALFLLMLAVFGGSAFGFYNSLSAGALRHEIANESNPERMKDQLEKLNDTAAAAAIDTSGVDSTDPDTAREAQRKLADALLNGKQTLKNHGRKANLLAAAFGVGLLGLFIVAIVVLRRVFTKFTGRLVFAYWLVAILGAYAFFLFQRNSYPMGIDLAGGSELTYVLDYTTSNENIKRAVERYNELKARDPEETAEDTRNARNLVTTLQQARDSAPDKAAEVVRKRVDPAGTKGIPVTTLGTDKQRLRIQLPKATPEEVERVKNAIKTQGRLTFHMVADPSVGSGNPKPELQNQEVHAQTLRKGKYTDPVTKIDYEKTNIVEKSPVSGKETKTEVVIKSLHQMDGSQIIWAGARSSQKGGFEIGIRFSPAGRVDFGNMTETYKFHKMAIVLDQVCHSAPVINEAIHGECVITGNFTKERAEELASVLQAGSLPAEVKEDSNFTVGPTLGREQIRSGMFATALAAGMVILFILWYYRFAGAVAAFCTLLNTVLLLGAMGFFKATLTLPGIAGIVLTLGMSVDANVLILERIREERDRGRPLRLAVAHGFDRAFLTIIDCQLTTILSGVVLYYLGSGPVRGFAVSLTIGIVATLFTNLWLNWVIMEWLVNREAMSKMNMVQMFKTPNFDFMKWRKPAMIFTGSTALACLLGFAIYPKDKLYDVDFTGGTLVQFNFAEGKAKDEQEVKRFKDEQIVPAVKKNAEEALARLKEETAKAVQDTERLNRELASAEGKAREDLAARLDTLKSATEINNQRIAVIDANLKNFGLDAQSFDKPEPGSSSLFRSYTVTTRATEPAIIAALDKAILDTFKADLEPNALETAGSEILIRFEKKAGLSEEKIKDSVRKAGIDLSKDPRNADIKGALEGLRVAEITEDGPYMVAHVPAPDAASRQRLVTELEQVKLADRAGGPISRKNAFGSQVASSLRWQSLVALLIANLGVFIYLWFRFEFSGAWGFGAIVALIHDVLLATGGVVVANALGFPILFDLNIVAALLSIVGFSVNDTIVVFDRIREVKAAHPTRSYEEIVNEAVNATLGRTVLTSATVLLADICLLIWGGPTIRGMAFALLVGFTVGVYSSVFIASPLMIWWYRKFGAGVAPVPSGTRPRAESGSVEPQV